MKWPPKLVNILFVVIGTAVGVIAQNLFENIIQKREKIELWSVSGCLAMNDASQFDVEDTLLSIRPPDQDLYRNGQFFIQNVPIRTRGDQKPSLLIRKDGFNTVEIILEDRPPEFYALRALTDYSIRVDRRQKTIEIEKQIILEREKAHFQ